MCVCVRACIGIAGSDCVLCLPFAAFACALVSLPQALSFDHPVDETKEVLLNIDAVDLRDELDALDEESSGTNQIFHLLK